jgi:hypothetical protein
MAGDGLPEGANDAEQPSGWLVFGLLAYLFGAAAVLLPLVISLWPEIESSASGDLDLVWGWLPVSVDPEGRQIVLAASMGALGAFLHATVSLGDYLGNRRFVTSWTTWYILRLPLGATLAVVFYFVIRAGFLTPDTPAEEVNAFGVAAVSALAGLFSKQATDKLREVFETLFRTDPEKGDAERADSLANPKPRISRLDPATATVGSDEVKVRILGSGFTEASTVLIGGEEREPNFQDEQELRITLGRDLLAQSARLEIRVSNPEPGGGSSAAKTFRVE